MNLFRNFNNKLLLTIFFALTFVISSCSHSEKKIDYKITIADSLKASRYTNIYFAGQPSKKDLNKLKAQGFSTVINLRTPKEHNESYERHYLQSRGINYYNIPFDNNSALTNEYLDKVTSAVMAHRKNGKILIHCSSGNRVGIWIGGHFHKDHNFSKKDSLEIAKKLGLHKKSAILKVESYLSKK